MFFSVDQFRSWFGASNGTPGWFLELVGGVYKLKQTLFYPLICVETMEIANISIISTSWYQSTIGTIQPNYCNLNPE